MSIPSDTDTLKVARDWLRARVDDGEQCPCCRQLAKVYQRKLSVASVRALIALYVNHKQDWAHLPTVLKKYTPDIAHQGGYANLSVHWGLMEEEKTRRIDGGRAGWWRVTDAGVAFIVGGATIQEYARLYDGRCLGHSGKPVTVKDALGTKFSYADLMKGV